MRLALVTIVIAFLVGLAGCNGNFADFMDLFGMNDSLGICQGGERQGADCEAPGDCPDGKCVERE